jgi:hypothetical protein
VDAVQVHRFKAKLPSLELKTWSKQILGSIRLDIVLPERGNHGVLYEQEMMLHYWVGMVCLGAVQNGPFQTYFHTLQMIQLHLLLPKSSMWNIE